MAANTSFEDLPVDALLCIFDYLSPADRYMVFFNLNQRFRTLIKQYTEFSRKALFDDICRFSTLHSWYKHLSYDNGGSLYFIFPTKGEQERYTFDPRVDDPVGLHWWFICKGSEKYIENAAIRKIVTRHSVRLNPSFYGLKNRSRNDEKRTKVLADIQEAAINIWNELKGLDDYNPWEN